MSSTEYIIIPLLYFLVKKDMDIWLRFRFKKKTFVWFCNEFKINGKYCMNFV